MVTTVQPRVLILRAPGTNCDQETAHAFRLAGGQPQILHINRLIEKPGLLGEFQILCIPGGFSYGDDLAAGRVLASRLQHYLQQSLAEFHEQGGLILGICNGFQALLKSGLLLEPDAQGAVATLTWNDSHKFEDRWVRLGVSSAKCVFLRGIDFLELPVAHAEGKFVARDAEILAQLESRGQLVLRYIAAEPQQTVTYPANPNGSMANVAGVCDPSGRVFGLMPHPERFVDRTQHPCWTRQKQHRPEGDGLAVFRNAVRFFQ